MNTLVEPFDSYDSLSRFHGDGRIRQRRVLVIEDNPDDVALIRRLMEREEIRCQCDFLNDGSVALLQLSKAKYDLVLLDISLPRVDGYEVMSTTRGMPVNKITPIVVLTNIEHEEALFDCYRAGANSVVQKNHGTLNYTKQVFEVLKYWLNVNHFQYGYPRPAGRNV